ncbi:hypothetical protein D3C71_1144790 [compost metagenome]
MRRAKALNARLARHLRKVADLAVDEDLSFEAARLLAKKPWPSRLEALAADLRRIADELEELARSSSGPSSS